MLYIYIYIYIYIYASPSRRWPAAPRGRRRPTLRAPPGARRSPRAPPEASAAGPLSFCSFIFLLSFFFFKHIIVYKFLVLLIIFLLPFYVLYMFFIFSLYFLYIFSWASTTSRPSAEHSRSLRAGMHIRLVIFIKFHPQPFTKPFTNSFNKNGMSCVHSPRSLRASASTSDVDGLVEPQQQQQNNHTTTTTTTTKYSFSSKY